MSIIKILLDLLFKQYTTIPIKEMPAITSVEVGAILRAYTDKVWLSDGTFRLVDTQNLGDFLASDAINGRPYVVEKHDCDDFSYELVGHVSGWNPDNTFGIVWGTNANGVGHAWNFFINEERELLFVEPQSDFIFAPTVEKIWVMIV